MEKNKNIYSRIIDNVKKNSLAVLAFVVVLILNFVFLKFIIEGVSKEMDPANPKAHMEKVLREFT